MLPTGGINAEYMGSVHSFMVLWRSMVSHTPGVNNPFFKFTHLNPPVGNICDMAHPWRLLASTNWMKDCSVSGLNNSFIYLLLAFSSGCDTMLIPPLRPRSKNMCIFTSRGISNLILVNFNPADQLSAGA